MTTFEQRLMDRLAQLDELHERLQPKSNGASPHRPIPKWVKEVQKRNPYYQEIFGNIQEANQ
jgi:hypothetical protein